MSYRFCCLVFFAIIFNINLLAQSPMSWQLSDENGLPSMLVYDIDQDQDGFIWFATEAGLYRFDGINFLKYSCATSKAIAVGNLTIDQKNRIWCQNFSDQIFYVENDSLKEFTAHLSYNIARFTTFGVDDDGIWLHTTQTGLVHNFNIENGTHFSTKVGVSWSPFVILKNKHNGVLIKKNDSLWQFDSKRNRLIPSHVFKLEKEQGSPKDYSHIFSDDENLLLVNYDKRKFAISTKDGSFLGNYSTKLNLQVLSFFKENDSTFWIGTSNGIMVYSVNSKTKRAEQLKTFKVGEYITRIFKDKEQTIWLSSLRNGVYAIPHSEIEVFDLVSEFATNPSITSIAYVNDALLLATSSGETFKGNYKSGFVKIAPQSQYEITSIEKVKNNKVLFGYTLYGLPNFNEIAKYNAGTVKDAHYYKNRIFFASGIGSMVGDFYAGNTKVEERLAVKSIKQIRARTSALDTVNGKWYVGYSNGLYAHNIDKPEESIEVRAGNESIFATSIALRSKGEIWVGTIGQGMYIIKPDGSFEHFTTDNGLLSNYVNEIEEHKQTVWIATTEGLQRYTPEKATKFINYTRFDGLASNEITGIEFTNDRIWVATAKNLNTFPIELNPVNNLPPKVFFKSCSMGQNRQQVKANETVPYDHDFLTFAFTGLAYKSKGKFQYKYRTLGLDSNWQFIAGANNVVNLFSLQPGAYTFQVKAINEDGIESITAAEFKFSVKTPFVQTTLFYILTVFVFSLTAFFIAYRRIKYIKNKNEVEKLKSNIELEKAKLEEQLRESQLTSLKSQLNPHFIFNALNSIQEFILLNNSLEANKYLGKFADLMRTTLELSSSRTCLLSEEIRALNLYLELESLRFEDSFTYKVELAKDINTEQIEIPSMLIQPYVENAIKHGLLHKKKDRWLGIRFSLNAQKNLLIIEIEDNGIGRTAAEKVNKLRNKQHKPFATSANEKRLQLLNAENKFEIESITTDLYNNEGLAIGTLVKLELPINSK